MSWDELQEVLTQRRKTYKAEKEAEPEACPNDGTPLRRGSDERLYCPFDGWRPSIIEDD